MAVELWTNEFNIWSKLSLLTDGFGKKAFDGIPP